MYEKLMALIKKPELNYQNVNNLYRALWDDDHISKGMLQSHLNPDEDGATLKHEFVAESVQWISRIAPPVQFAKLLDLGCGPGIYAEHFVKAGYNVTGIDYSRRSLSYAKEKTTENGSAIEYIYQNYLTIDYTEKFDVVTIINRDYAVLSVTDRMTLLRKIFQALKPGGKFIFDVMTPKMREAESQAWYNCEKGGFYSEKPYILLEAVYQLDDADKTEIGQHVVVTDDDVNCYITPNHYFTKESLISELQSVGFRSLEFYGDVAGKEYSEAGDNICVVAVK